MNLKIDYIYINFHYLILYNVKILILKYLILINVWNFWHCSE